MTLIHFRSTLVPSQLLAMVSNNSSSPTSTSAILHNVQPQYPPSSPGRSATPPSPRSNKRSRRACVQQYFQQYPPEAWSLGAFEVYCRQSEFDGWHASNINGFWLEFLTEYHNSGTAEERKKAAKLVANVSVLSIVIYPRGEGSKVNTLKSQGSCLAI